MKINAGPTGSARSRIVGRGQGPTIDPGKSSRAGRVILWRVSGRSYRPMPSGQENLTMGDGEGYSKIRRNGSRFAASNRGDFQALLP